MVFSLPILLCLLFHWRGPRPCWKAILHGDSQHCCFVLVPSVSIDGKIRKLLYHFHHSLCSDIPTRPFAASQPYMTNQRADTPSLRELNQDLGGNSDHQKFLLAEIELQMSVESGRMYETTACWDIGREVCFTMTKATEDCLLSGTV
ncbi:hypothetical protein BDQ94DRAFT_14407 [Aspergillus welwitschiae]|uniref:Uncharacterized protein n=1 Tax=Aspergillus welwitschiae TaxID=1341132 RepID=A0A3F3Q683_9EURO|nr:hypothetical protein BDQ94DRAFT_14407 [Aspergillus welwitschiae]RDH34690.1 hypothetical protein BDQ94DRAFT_14407 [Aspergillus welwitschiae]